MENSFLILLNMSSESTEWVAGSTQINAVSEILQSFV